MEGVGGGGGGGGGSRMSRASSRYGSTAVFNGPVRRWKKRWVHISSPSSASLVNGKPRFHSNNASPLFLCRWTPLSAAGGGVPGDGDGSPDEPPKRKFRYTPVAVLEEQRKAGKMEEGANDNLQGAQKSVAEDASNFRMALSAEGIKIEKQESRKNRFDLGLSLEDPDEYNGP
ncbi:hypothetical protein MLD38_000715 [Melastoma candidum]|uniref:Uncharacterized protein n=1 Tax=Melastoma candidum TaxID=119954 RepID=A0ACB9SC83_9MYRT|nr:hypothetical protein MLD38_000715 [Melastoma candidum]